MSLILANGKYKFNSRLIVGTGKYANLQQTKDAIIASGAQMVTVAVKRVNTSDDPIIAQKLEDIGCIAIMPLGAPIGSGLGLQNKLNIKFIIQQSKVPIIVDAGVGLASHAVEAMELGCDGVLMNTAIAKAKEPIKMATAMKLAIQSGRLCFEAGAMQQNYFATPSSPLDGVVGKN